MLRLQRVSMDGKKVLILCSCKLRLRPASPNGVELKAERRKPSGEKHRDIEGIPSLTGVLAHFRLH
jgi:hypothetical protein